MVLPCKHQQEVVEQVPRTINLLVNMDSLHPDILLQHDIAPRDYTHGLVFRSAVESIRGTFIASSTVGREALVRDVFENLLQRGEIDNYVQNQGARRYDFTVAIDQEPDYFAAIEVKGGEGNSINISERPLWAREFAIWSHLDGAIVNQPAHGAHSIVNRISNELVRRQKHVDMLFFKDTLCGTGARPCPKYQGREDQIGMLAAPDVFLFPQRIPSIEDPSPPAHNLESLRLPRLVLNLFDVAPEHYDRHVWYVEIRVIQQDNGKLVREVSVTHQGKVVDQSRSRPWTA